MTETTQQEWKSIEELGLKARVDAMRAEVLSMADALVVEAERKIEGLKMLLEMEQRRNGTVEDRKDHTS